MRNVGTCKTQLFSASSVFHYQVKVHFFSETQQSFTEQPMKISLYGTHGEKEDIPFVLYVDPSWMCQTSKPQVPYCVTLTFWFPPRPELNSNTTVSFLLTTDVDLGDLMIVKLRWEKDAIISWSDWWGGSSKVHIRKLRIKSGESQSK